MELEPNYEATTIVNDYGLDSKEDLGTFVLPSVDGAKKIVFYEIAPLCVSSTSKDKDAAIEALKSWFTKENQTVFTDITGFLCSSQVTVDNECVNQMVAYTTDSDNYSMMLRYYENIPSDVRDVALEGGGRHGKRCFCCTVHEFRQYTAAIPQMSCLQKIGDHFTVQLIVIHEHRVLP